MRPMRPVELLPTLVTLGNLFSGFLAIAYLTDSLALDRPDLAAQRIGLYEKAIYLIFLAMLFDALDGFVARLTGHTSPFGAQVDSICDAVSFGAAPALLFKVLCEADPQVVDPKLALNLAVVFLAGAVLRLARFNLETESAESSHRWFEGLPTPGAAAVVASLAYANIELDPQAADSWVRDALPYLMPVLALLMVSRIPYVHLGVLLARRKSFPTVVFLVFFAVFAVLFIDVVLPLFCTGFLLTGPLVFAWRRLTGRQAGGSSLV